MKKGFFKTFIVSIIMAFVFAFSACNKGPQVYVDSYFVTSGDETLTHFVDDEFSLEGYELTLIMTDGSVKKVELSNDMIKKQPIMNQEGDQNVSFQYNGETYSFRIKVYSKERKEFLEKLKETLLNFDSLTELPKELTIATQSKFSASYLGNKVESGVYEGDITIVPGKLILGEFANSEIFIDFGEDELAAFVYFAFLNNFVANSLTPDNEDILDLEQQIIEFDFNKYVLDFFIDLTSFDLMPYLMNFIFTEDNLFYIEYITNFIANAFYIDIVFDEGDDQNKIDKTLLDLQNFATGIVTRVRNCEFKNIDPKAEINKLSQIIYDYSMDEMIKMIIKEAALNSTGYDCSERKVVKEEVDYKHMVSNFISAFGGVIQVYIQNEDGSVSYDDSSKARDYANEYVKKIGTIIRTVEDYVVGSFEAAIKQERFETKEMLDKIVLACNEYKAYAIDVKEENNWYISDLEYQIVNIMALVEGIVDIYNENPRVYIVNLIEYFQVIENLLIHISGGVVPEEYINLITNVIYDIIKPNPDYDYEQYITTVCGMLGITDEATIQGYIDTFRETKTITLLTDYYSQYIEYMKDPEISKAMITDIARQKYMSNAEAEDFFQHRIEAFEELYVMVRYLEHIPINGFEPIVLISYINTTLDNINKGFIDEQSTKHLLQIAMQFLNIEDTIKSNFKKVLATYELELVTLAKGLICSALGITDNNSVAYKELETIISYGISEYINGTLDYVSVMNSFFKTVNAYCTEDIKVVANALGMLISISLGKDSDVKIDYNKLFQYIELPNEVNKIDYNELVERLWNESTYDIFSITQPIIQFISDDDGNIIGEYVSFALKIDFDITISTFNAEMNCYFVIPFNND